jgi:hypothetical protein
MQDDFDKLVAHYIDGMPLVANLSTDIRPVVALCEESRGIPNQPLSSTHYVVTSWAVNACWMIGTQVRGPGVMRDMR